MIHIVVISLLSAAPSFPGIQADAGIPMPPSGLLVQLLRYPESTLIVERTPCLSWMVNDPARGAVQTAYQIQVASAEELLKNDSPDLWDSGKVLSPESVGISYIGKELTSHTSYWWHVRTWNATGEMTAYSQPQQFNTGDFEATRTWPSESRWCKLGNRPDGDWALEDRQAMQYEEREPVVFRNDEKGGYFIDFGKAAFGQVQMNVPTGARNCRIQIHAGEKLDVAGHVDRNPGPRVSYQRFVLHLKKGKHSYTLQPERHRGPIPLPEHLGEVFPFRYAEILDCPVTLTSKDVKQRVLVYPFDDTAASFSCSNQTLNEIWELCRYTMKATNFLGVFIDGQRERMPYEADAYINQLGYYCCDREYAISRYSHEYLLYHPTWPTEWILQSPFMAWADYIYTGHPDSLQKFYGDLQAKTLLPLAREDGLISTQTVSSNLRNAMPEHVVSEEEKQRAAAVLTSIHMPEGLNDIVDWPKGERDGYEFVPVNTVVNAFHYGALQLLARIANVLGRGEDAGMYQDAANKTREAFNAKLFDPVRGLYVDGEGSSHVSLHGNMFPLALGLAPEERKAGIATYLRSKGMACSVYGAQWLLEALYDANQEDYALALMTDTQSDRSWPHMLHDVGTTITLEAWDMKYKPNSDWNHAWGAAPANIIPRKLMGIEPLTAGWSKARICPRLGSLEWAQIAMPTIRGTIELACRKEANTTIYDVRLPATMAAEMCLPADNPACVTEEGLPASEATGVEYLRQEDGRAVFLLHAGRYSLVEHDGLGTHR